jgi:hypothetical protein
MQVALHRNNCSPYVGTGVRSPYVGTGVHSPYVGTGGGSTVAPDESKSSTATLSSLR